MPVYTQKIAQERNPEPKTAWEQFCEQSGKKSTNEATVLCPFGRREGGRMGDFVHHQITTPTAERQALFDEAWRRAPAPARKAITHLNDYLEALKTASEKMHNAMRWSDDVETFNHPQALLTQHELLALAVEPKDMMRNFLHAANHISNTQTREQLFSLFLQRKTAPELALDNEATAAEYQKQLKSYHFVAKQATSALEHYRTATSHQTSPYTCEADIFKPVDEQKRAIHTLLGMSEGDPFDPELAAARREDVAELVAAIGDPELKPEEFRFSATGIAFLNTAPNRQFAFIQPALNRQPFLDCYRQNFPETPSRKR